MGVGGRTMVGFISSSPKKTPMSKPTRPAAKLRQISIRNYKGIENVELALPGPRMEADPDVMVIGSQNGLGKTSILECCSLLLSTLTEDPEQWRFLAETREWPVDLPDLLVRAGAEQFKLDGKISLEDRQCSVSSSLNRQGEWKSYGKKLEKAREAFDATEKSKGIGRELVGAISGMSADPVLAESFLFFHSYRKVMEGHIELGMMADESSYDLPYWRSRWRRYDSSMSSFKVIILRSLMQRAGLFEVPEVGDSSTAIDKLNDLLKIYADGTISKKLRPRADNTVEFRIDPNRGGDSFTFDGLSSGQKEIISTLFLIWHYTQERPSVVLIDEPELHLNAQWHRRFVNTLLDLAPHNQYVVATHSTDVMDSVDEDRRLLLEE
ncbi:MAG: hypothetical protein TQ37_06775 [Candidatus Synechococcus spongiarum 15L]|uniref:ATPase AAA-type core domain-containing protein n=1 Tax=Candidatus Synechococcus spongiarum 15L TaxID=1608419 RepID=A0A0G8AU11_9SYNE|nr:MAG: hypothetical protein TQ37_06775 [Candidatus Synechococcus spongiarum 15L]